jgi:hypothetical protein
MSLLELILDLKRGIDKAVEAIVADLAKQSKL